MSDKTLYWHDYETFGSDPRRDRPCQFAGLRTDEDLNEIDDPLVIYCKPSPDFLPHPEACLVTGIGPREAAAKGMVEAEFAGRILEQFAQPGTCVAGYNNIRFDDEVTRHLLYRCFHDPYEREWKHSNSRWDIIDMLRLTHAVRPEGINWPRHEDGTPSFRLEHLTVANGIGHEDAHDALSDVRATIAVARLVKQAQPRLYDYLYQHRHKNALAPLLDLRERTPLLHVSSMYPASRGCLAVVMPLARHPRNSNGIIVYDLSVDPAAWLDWDVETIRERLFTRREDLPEGAERIALKTVHLNKCPVLAPLGVLDAASRERHGIDLEAAMGHRQVLLASRELERRISAVFESEQEVAPVTDPDLMLYSGGFFSPQDKSLIAKVPYMAPAQLASAKLPFRDPRLPEMLFRYRARNFPASLSQEERQRWHALCRQRLSEAGPGLTLMQFQQALNQARGSADPARQALLDELQQYAVELTTELDLSAPATAEP